MRWSLLIISVLGSILIFDVRIIATNRLGNSQNVNRKFVRSNKRPRQKSVGAKYYDWFAQREGLHSHRIRTFVLSRIRDKLSLIAARASVSHAGGFRPCDSPSPDQHLSEVHT